MTACPPVGDPTRRRCETIDGDLVDPCDAVIAALVGHVRRLAVWMHGTRCLWPGCGRHHCQIDHTHPWHDHGPTNPDNAGPTCGHHNRWKTRGYHTWRDPNGHWHTHRPDGTEIHPI